MNTIEKRKVRLIEELKNKEYRDEFVSSNVDVGVAFQVRALRKQRNWTQEKLADISKKKQKTISDLENPSNSPTISTLKKIATAFEVGLVVRFVPFGDMVKWDLNLSAGSLEVPSFEDDPFFKETDVDLPMADIDKYQTGLHTQETSGEVVNIGELRENFLHQQRAHLLRASFG